MPEASITLCINILILFKKANSEISEVSEIMWGRRSEEVGDRGQCQGRKVVVQ